MTDSVLDRASFEEASEGSNPSGPTFYYVNNALVAIFIAVCNFTHAISLPL